MTETIVVRGFVATYPTLKRLPNGTPVANFRLASTPRWFDNATQTWKEGSTNWFTINAFRQLAHNASRSLQVGHPVFVSGKLKVRSWQRDDGSTGQSVEIDAQVLGHDLALGTSGFQRNVNPQAPASDQPQEQGATNDAENSAGSIQFSRKPDGNTENGQGQGGNWQGFGTDPGQEAKPEAEGSQPASGRGNDHDRFNFGEEESFEKSTEIAVSA